MLSGHLLAAQQPRAEALGIILGRFAANSRLAAMITDTPITDYFRTTPQSMLAVSSLATTALLPLPRRQPRTSYRGLLQILARR
jgi:hypothetical protein